MPLNRVPIEQLTGVNRNAADGQTLSPRKVFNASFKREGGLTVLGGAAFDITPDIVDANVLAYDESAMALLDAPAVWTNNLSLIGLTAPEFSQRNITLIPRGGVVTEFVRDGDSFSGRAFVRSPLNEYQELSGAPSITVTQSAGGSFDGGAKLEFICVAEAPTDAGLLAYGVSRKTFDTTTPNGRKLKIELDDVLPPSHVARFYWRARDTGGSLTTHDRYALLAELVSDGVNVIEFELTAPPAHADTEDTIVNFAPYRAEIHEGRVFGVASDRPFLTLAPSSAIKRRDAYFQRTIQDDKTLAAFTTNDAQSVMRQGGDFMIWKIRRMDVTRKTEGAPIVVPLARLAHVANPSRVMDITMVYPADGSRPRIRVQIGADVAEGVIPPPGIPGVDASATSSGGFDSFDLELDIASVSGSTVGFVFTVVAAGAGVPVATVAFSGTFADWTDWEQADTTSVSLFGSASARDSFAVKWTRVSAGGIGIGDPEFAADIRAYGSGLTWQNAALETWTLATVDDVVVMTYLVEGGADIEFSQPRQTLIYSDAGYANRGTEFNYFVLTASNSAEITALASTPAGLLIFMNNETWLLTGNVDPFFSAVSQVPQARIQRFSGTIGCDRGVIPGRLGGVVFPIYRGELYAITLGMGDVDFGSGLQPIGAPVNLREDPFVQVVGEPQTNHIVARTRAGLVYRYDTETKQWVDDPLSGSAAGAIDVSGDAVFILHENDDNIEFEGGGVVRDEQTPDNNRLVLIPACLCQTYGTRYIVKNRFAAIDLRLRDKVSVKWEALHLGDKTLNKFWRRVELVTSPSYAGTPKMIYSVDGGNDKTSIGFPLGNGKWGFNFDRGTVGVELDVEFELDNFGFEDTLVPPITFEIAARNRSRGRVG